MASVRRGAIARGVVLARTADRSVLGRMNDMAFLCEHAIAETGGLARTELTGNFSGIR